MTLLVTGASGFLGSEISRQLSLRGDDYRILDRNGIHQNGQRVTNCDFDLVNCDIPSPKNLEGYLKLVHLAWDGLPNYESDDHLHQLLGHKEFLFNAVSAGVRSIFVAGSCIEYGLAEGPLTSSSVARPTTPYGQAKLELLQFLFDLKKKRDFSFAWGRFFYLYGENQNKNSLYPYIQEAVKTGGPIYLKSNGKQIRDFISVKNAALITLRILDKGCDQEIVNIGSGNPMMVMEWVRRQIPSASKSRIEVSTKSWPKYEPSAAWAADPYS
jgi:dTDP-6-deoxy-L-talose 4-dehydrogenase (NAD+)